MHIANPAIPLGSVVVVIGANGYMGLETCEKLLQAGYRVRGTVRNVGKHRGWMHRLFDGTWPGKFELVQVLDFEAEGAFEDAFQGGKSLSSQALQTDADTVNLGVAGVIHPSMPVIFDADPAKVLGPMVRGVINTLEAAARAGVQRYVLSSSSKAVADTVYGKGQELTAEMFNHGAVERAHQESTDASFQRIVDVYTAGRTLAELAFWDWIKANDPPFIANCLVPDGQFGRALDADNLNMGVASSTGQLIRALHGEWEGVPLPLAFFTDVQDSARLMVAAVASEPIRNERIFAYYVNRTWNDMRSKVRELFPDRPELVKGSDQEISGRDLSYAPGPIARAEEILRDIGRPGFTSEDDVIRDFVASNFPQGAQK